MARTPGKTDYASEFGKVLEDQLSRKGMRQSDLARGTAVSPSYINRLMTGSKVSPEWADFVADVTKATPEERARLHAAAAASWGYKLDLTKE